MDKLLNAAKNGATILTPNRRLSAWLLKFYNQHQADTGELTWTSPDILPFNAWLLRLWHDYQAATFEPTPTLLSPLQEAYVWESIVSASPVSANLLQVTEAASTAKSGWDLLNQWQLDTTHSIYDEMEDCRAFKAWCGEFATLCHSQHLLANSELVTFISDLLAQDKIQLNNSILLVGFNELTPAVKKLAETLANKGVLISQENVTEQNSHQHLIACDKMEDEVTLAAKWARKLAEKHPDRKIGVVIPNLDKSRDRIKQIFTNVFERPDAYNITAGMPLAQYPVIKAALELLQLNKAEIAQREFSNVMTTPFIADAEKELIRRASFDAYLRRENHDVISLQDFCNTESHLYKQANKSIPKLAKRLNDYIASINTYSSKHTYLEWSQIFSNLLQTIGWPGERSINSEEYQVIEKWFETLNQFKQLDYIATPATYASALHALHKIVQQNAFQAKTPDTNIQVMGILEAAALPFDHLWVAGLDDTSWPPQPKPSAFIPLKIQRSHNMPHATSKRELEYCEQMTQQFKRSAPDIIFSYAKKVDEMDVNKSPLLANIKELDYIETAGYQPLNEIIQRASALEVYHDEQAPALVENEKIHGGVTVIKDQSLCPFKSFTTWRLHARELEEPLPGLRKKDRGTMTHQLLEEIWNKIGSHAKLTTYAHSTLTKVISTCIDTVIDGSSQFMQQRHQFRKLEKQRLLNLMLEWFAIEMRRPAFEIIGHEVTIPIKMGGLSLEARVDRIDSIDGNHFIIDYKTSSLLNINNWFGDHPEEPQLPIYAIQDDKCLGVSFAQVYIGNCSYKGVVSDDIGVEGVREISKIRHAEDTWTNQINTWQATMSDIAEQFVAGHAAVDPVNGVETCSRCSLQPVCRINEESSI